MSQQNETGSGVFLAVVLAIFIAGIFWAAWSSSVVIDTYPEHRSQARR